MFKHVFYPVGHSAIWASLVGTNMACTCMARSWLPGAPTAWWSRKRRWTLRLGPLSSKYFLILSFFLRLRFTASILTLVSQHYRVSPPSKYQFAVTKLQLSSSLSPYSSFHYLRIPEWGAGTHAPYTCAFFVIRNLFCIILG